MEKQRVPARIIDLDGTAVDVRAALHWLDKTNGLAKDEAFIKFHEDVRYCPPFETVLAYMREAHARGEVVVILTARLERHRQQTLDWLADHVDVPFDGPYMRPDDDRRNSEVFKRDMVRYLKRHYEVVGAIDDDPDNVAMFLAEGIPEVIQMERFDYGVATA